MSRIALLATQFKSFSCSLDDRLLSAMWLCRDRPLHLGDSQSCLSSFTQREWERNQYYSSSWVKSPWQPKTKNLRSFYSILCRVHSNFKAVSHSPYKVGRKCRLELLLAPLPTTRSRTLIIVRCAHFENRTDAWIPNKNVCWRVSHV